MYIVIIIKLLAIFIIAPVYIIVGFPIYIILILLVVINFIFISIWRREYQFITKICTFLYGLLLTLGVSTFYLIGDSYLARNEGVFKRNYFKEQFILDWSDINCIKREFKAPFFCYFAYLHNGKKLRIDNIKDLLNIIKDKNIKLGD